MAITFLEKRKIQRYLILVLVVVVFVILLVIWKGFFQKPELVQPTAMALKLQKIEINWNVLKDPRLQSLELFEEIEPLEEEIGRENPFIPYE